MSGLFWSTDNFTNLYCASTDSFGIFFIFTLCRFQADFTLMDTCWVGYIFLLVARMYLTLTQGAFISSSSCSWFNSRRPGSNCSIFPLRCHSLLFLQSAVNSCHQDQGWRRWQEGEVCALCAAVHSKVFYILGNEIEETLVAQSHSKEPTQRDFLSLVTSLAGSLILWRLKIVISFVCDKGWIYGIPKIFHQQWMGFVLTMNWSMLSAGQPRGGGSSPGPGTGGWVFILRKLLIMISHDST